MRAETVLKAVLGCFLVISASQAMAVEGSNSYKPHDDPYEDFNRHMFALNDSLDKAIFKPVATVYQTVMPSIARKGVTHFFANIDEIPTIVNDGFQAEGRHMMKDTSRLAINTTIGIGGLFDVASDMGIEKHYEDFGLTLAKWGYGPSNYLVLPLLGPSTVRDTLGLPVDYFASIYPYIDENVSITLYAIEVTNSRANLLAYNGVYAQAFDPYVFVRNAYLQRRDRKIVSDEESNAHADGNGDNKSNSNKSASADSNSDEEGDIDTDTEI